MGTTVQRIGKAGVTLVEMLVVLAVIGLLSAVLVPVAIRGGWGAGSETAFAARDVFTMLKAARVYASTHNVETALVYGGNIVRDSEMALDSNFPDPCVAIVDSVLLARRLTREEMILINESSGTASFQIDRNYYFTPVNTAADSTFRTMPKQTALLTDMFQVVVDNSGVIPTHSATGLAGVLLFDPSEGTYGEFLEPRRDACTDPSASPLPVLDYALDSLPDATINPGTYSFPAHRFMPDGSMRVPESFAPQRIRFRVGALPNREYDDRFGSGASREQLTPQLIPVMFDTTTPEVSVRYIADNASSGDSSDDYNAEVDVTLELFVPTGRVKLLP